MSVALAVAAFGLLAIGLYALLAERHLIKVIIALQIVEKGVLVALVAAGAAAGQIGLGQSLAVTVIVTDTVVAVIALALSAQVRRRFGTLDVRVLSRLRG